MSSSPIGRASIAYYCAAMFICNAAVAQNAAEPMKALTGYAGPTDTPGVGKVVLAFALTLIVGVSMVWALRKFLPRMASMWPKFGGSSAAPGALRVVDTRIVHAGLRVHVVEVEGVAVMIAEGRTGIAMSILPARSGAGSQSTSADARGA